MADQSPNSSFLGIDASSVQIESGRKAISAAGLKNIELRCQNILDFPLSEGKFDYIIVHGIFSWVPEVVREKILAICEAHLSEKGVAYISYNALPGWNMRRTIRDMMSFHTAAFAEPQTKVAQARALLKFLSDSVPTQGNAYGILLKSELDMIGKVADSYLLHDYLEEENTPFYFHDFIGRAAKHRLQYLAEPNLGQMLASNFSESVNKALSQLGNIVAQEQYMDFLRNRMFRQTLLCRAGISLNRNVTPERVKDIAVQPLLMQRNDPVDLAPGVSVAFKANGGQDISVSDTFLKAVLSVLSERTAEVHSFGALLREAQTRARSVKRPENPDQTSIEEATLAQNLMSLYAKGMLEVWAAPLALAAKLPEKPRVSPLVRHQSTASRYLTNYLHAPVPADVLGREVVLACDGQRSKSEIVSAVVAQVKAGKINVQEGGQPVSDEKRLHELLRPQVENVLDSLVRGGFFAN